MSHARVEKPNRRHTSSQVQRTEVAEQSLESILTSARLLDGPDDEAAPFLTERLQPVSFRRNATVFRCGDVANQLYVVISGKVKIVHTSGDGRPLLMAVMGAGDVFGELELLDPSVRVSTATTLTHVTAVALDRNGLHEWIAFHPAVTTRFLSALTRRLRYTQNTVYDVVSADAPGRVAKQLLALAHQFGTQEGTSVRVAHGLTQDEFAQLVGSTRETVNRALRDFAQRGWIRLECRTVHIDNPRRLARRAKLLDAVTTGTHPRPASKSISTKATMRRGHTSSRKTDFQSRPSRSRT